MTGPAERQTNVPRRIPCARCGGYDDVRTVWLTRPKQRRTQAQFCPGCRALAVRGGYEVEEATS
jgi:hypothetical protein